MKTIIAKELLKNLPLGLGDAARLVLECTEELGGASGSREELLSRIRRVVREGVRALREAERTECFARAAWASVEARSDRRPTTRRDLRHFVRRMLRVEGVSELPLRRMSAADCRSLLQKAFGSSLSSYRKGRAILHSVFAFGKRQGWCSSNPVEQIEIPSVQERQIPPLSLEEIRRLETAAEMSTHAPMRFSLYLMLYCGLRPNEVRRLRPEDLCREEREVIIRPTVSKTGGGRIVPLRRQLPRGELLIPGCWEARWRALRRAAGLTQWRADACRHTFASYHAAYFRDMPALQWEMGHRSLQLLRTRYISPLPRRQAKAFWMRD